MASCKKTAVKLHMVILAGRSKLCAMDNMDFIMTFVAAREPILSSDVSSFSGHDYS